MKATNGSSKYGGLIFARNSTQRVAQAQWYSSMSTAAGGFAAATDGSLIFINDSTLVRGKSKDGGAIWLKNSRLAARNLSIAHCEADDGGGVMGIDFSTFLCADCALHNNTAKERNGGGVFIDVDREQTLTLQFIRSTFTNNVAKLGGKRFFRVDKTILIITCRWTRLPVN